MLSAVDFAVYDRQAAPQDYLNSLGPLAMAERGSRSGIDDPTPEPKARSAREKSSAGQTKAPQTPRIARIG